MFEKGYGIDFYLDGLRFLPDNVTVVKAIIRVVNSKYKDIFGARGIVAALPKFRETNDTFKPIFDFRHEYRADFFDPTSIILMTFVTIDKAHNEPRILGHSAINLFEKKFGGGGQPESPNDTVKIELKIFVGYCAENWLLPIEFVLSRTLQSEPV